MEKIKLVSMTTSEGNKKSDTCRCMLALVPLSFVVPAVSCLDISWRAIPAAPMERTINAERGDRASDEKRRKENLNLGRARNRARDGGRKFGRTPFGGYVRPA